jgi:hypothetical protein
MAITYAQLVDQLNIVIGEEHDGRLDENQIVNQAGQFLVGLHPWRWLARPSVLLDLVADQSWVRMPPDFGNGTILGVTREGTLTFDVALSTLQELDLLGRSTVSTPSMYHVALAYPSQSDTVSPLGLPRLEIDPTPATDQEEAIRFAYIAGWVTMTMGSAVANVPPWAEMALIQCVRAFGAYYRTNDHGHVDSLVTSPEMQSMKRADSGQQRILGQSRGGILQGGKPTGSTNYNWSHAGVS